MKIQLYIRSALIEIRTWEQFH